MNSRAIISTIRADGSFKVARDGSYIQFKHPVKGGRVTAPHLKRDVPQGT